MKPHLLLVFLLPWMHTGIGLAQVPNEELRITVHYDGQVGEVDADHGILLTLFASPNLSDPSNTMVAARYVTENGALTTFSELPAQPLYLVAIYDEVGSWPGTGSIPGPIGLHLPEDKTAPAPLNPGETAPVVVRFDDSIHPPKPPNFVSRDSAKLQGAEGLVEIRIYTIKDGLREEFASFFEKTLEAQRRHGLEVAGHFRSLDDDNVFVWLRRFNNQEERLRSSRNFYLGTDWMGSRNAEAARYIESTEVMLVEPTSTSGLR